MHRNDQTEKLMRFYENTKTQYVVDCRIQFKGNIFKGKLMLPPSRRPSDNERVGLETKTQRFSGSAGCWLLNLSFIKYYRIIAEKSFNFTSLIKMVTQ